MQMQLSHFSCYFISERDNRYLRASQTLCFHNRLHRFEFLLKLQLFLLAVRSRTSKITRLPPTVSPSWTSTTQVASRCRKCRRIKKVDVRTGKTQPMCLKKRSELFRYGWSKKGCIRLYCLSQQGPVYLFYMKGNINRSPKK